MRLKYEEEEAEERVFIIGTKSQNAYLSGKGGKTEATLRKKCRERELLRVLPQEVVGVGNKPEEGEQGGGR